MPAKRIARPSERKIDLEENPARNGFSGDIGLIMSKNTSYVVYYKRRSLPSEPRRKRRDLVQYIKIAADGPPHVTHILSEKYSTKGKPLERVGRKASDLLGSSRLWSTVTRANRERSRDAKPRVPGSLGPLSLFASASLIELQRTKSAQQATMKIAGLPQLA